MIEHNKTYGFTIAVKELKETVPNIFRYASAYKRTNNITSQGLWEMFLEDPPRPKEPAKENPDDKPLPDEILQTQPGNKGIQDIDPEAMEGEKYNMCHFWSNFEIARLDWFRSKEYEDFFNMMDKSGGFWMERVSTQPHPKFDCNGILTSVSSGVMHRSIHLRPVSCLHPKISITSEILDIDIPQFSIAQPTPLPVNRTGFPTSK